MPKPPPWAYPLGTVQEAYHNDDRMSKSTSQVIDRAMGQFMDAKVKFVSVSLSVEDQCCDQPFHGQSNLLRFGQLADLEYVRVVLTADPRLRFEDIEDQEPPRRKEHRRVPSMIAMEEVKVRNCACLFSFQYIVWVLYFHLFISPCCMLFMFPRMILFEFCPFHLVSIISLLSQLILDWNFYCNIDMKLAYFATTFEVSAFSKYRYLHLLPLWLSSNVGVSSMWLTCLFSIVKYLW